jgi:hypothetical protein
MIIKRKLLLGFHFKPTHFIWDCFVVDCKVVNSGELSVAENASPVVNLCTNEDKEDQDEP